MRTRQRTCTNIAYVAMLVTIFGGGSLYAAPVIINFEQFPGLNIGGLPEASPIPEYAQLFDQLLDSHGILFTSGSPYVAVLSYYRCVPSGNNFIQNSAPDGTLTASSDYPIMITFFKPGDPSIKAVTDFVSIRGDLCGDGRPITLKAFDVDGNLVGSSTKADWGAILTVSTASKIIHEVRLYGHPEPYAEGVAWDDLTFNPPEFTEPPEPPDTPAEQIQYILDFIDESVTNGTLVGEGPGKSGTQHLDKFITDLEEVQAHIAIGSWTRALQLLDLVLKHSGWIEGDARSEIVEGIRTLQALVAVAGIDQAKRTGIFVDTGFDVKRDGFTFANTGNLIPDDKWWWNWLEMQKAACLGMSAYAQTYYVEQVKNQPNPVHLADISDNQDYRVAVNQSQWVTALGDWWHIFWSNFLPWPSHGETIEAILSEMYKSANPVVVLLDDGSGGPGHAILAYAIWSDANRIIIEVYDPNFPQDKNHRIIYDKYTGEASYPGWAQFDYMAYELKLVWL